MRSSLATGTAVVVVLVGLLGSGLSTMTLGGSYLTQTSAEKLDTIWKHVTADTTSGSFMNPLWTLRSLMKTSYLWKMADTGLDWRPATHRKITHGIGMHARAHFEWTPNNYTGLFQQADNCVVRLANAAKPGGVLMGTYGPNMGIKCTRDGEAPSGNLELIFEIDGYDKYPPGTTKSCSYFEGALLNHCARRDDISSGLQIFVNQFAKVDDRPLLLGVSQMATATQSGHNISKPNFPFALIFQPDPALNLVPCSFDDYTSQLRGLAGENRTLYKVYGVVDPWVRPAAGKPDVQLLGSLVLDSNFTPSVFGDHQLFFSHTFFHEEIATLQQTDSGRAQKWLDYTDPDVDSGMANQKVEGHLLYDMFLPPYSGKSVAEAELRPGTLLRA